jgi:hypothetical protein
MCVHFRALCPHCPCIQLLYQVHQPWVLACCTRAEHGCTCWLPGSLPAGILGGKSITWTHKDLLPHITWIRRSKTCRSQVTVGVPEGHQQIYCVALLVRYGQKTTTTAIVVGRSFKLSLLAVVVVVVALLLLCGHCCCCAVVLLLCHFAVITPLHCRCSIVLLHC